jgi:hypothetical protein
MFYRYVGQRRKAIDLDGIFDGSCFLIGGAPSLSAVKDKFIGKPIVKMAMNNAATVVRPDLWVGADIPSNYSSSVILDPAPMKFTYISRRDDVINDIPWKNIPNTYFVSSSQIKECSFFLNGRDFVWLKNVFTLALQILYRLGFNKVYTIGCAFKINKDSQYSYDTKLNDEQIKYTLNTYNSVMNQLAEILRNTPQGFELISCTPDSRLNDLVKYVSIDDAIKEAVSHIPTPNTIDCKHPVS